MKKINNKGFVISSILYTLLISFLLMLALLLLQFKSSSDVINNASKDLVNGDEFKAVQLLDNNYVSFTDSSGNLVTLDGDDTGYVYYDDKGDSYNLNGNYLKYTCVGRLPVIENSKIYKTGEGEVYNYKKNGESYVKDHMVLYEYNWFNPPNKMLVRINSRYGTVYWPRDFYPSDNYPTYTSSDGITIESFDNHGIISPTYKNINVSVELTSEHKLILKITDNNNLGLGLVNGSKCDGDTDDDPKNCIVLSKPSTGCD